MGLDVSALLILGVHLEEKIKLTHKTKYNQDTGEPYTIEEETKVFVLDNTDIEIKGEEHVHYCNYEDKDSYFIGIEVVSTNSHRISGIPWEEVPEVNNEEVSKIKKALAELGYKGEMKQYLLQQMSY